MITNLPDIIFLCGFMGSGKSTVGRQLADKLERPFLDLDDRIVEIAGLEIPEIFEQEGEPAFRTTERRALLEVARDYKGVVALGGGSLQSQHLVDHLKLKGLLLFIETPISVILSRISQDENRPMLLDKHGNPQKKEVLKQELQALYDERLPLYEQAVIKVANDGSKSPEQIAEILLKKIRNHVEYY